MNILEQFETIAHQRLSEHGSNVKITKSQFSKYNDVYFYEICVDVDEKWCKGEGGSQGVAIDECIKSLRHYEESAERVQLQSE